MRKYTLILVLVSLITTGCSKENSDNLNDEVNDQKTEVEVSEQTRVEDNSIGEMEETEHEDLSYEDGGTLGNIKAGDEGGLDLDVYTMIDWMADYTEEIIALQEDYYRNIDANISLNVPGYLKGDSARALRALNKNISQVNINNMVSIGQQIRDKSISYRGYLEEHRTYMDGDLENNLYKNFLDFTRKMEMAGELAMNKDFDGCNMRMDDAYYILEDIDYIIQDMGTQGY